MTVKGEKGANPRVSQKNSVFQCWFTFQEMVHLSLSVSLSLSRRVLRATACAVHTQTDGGKKKKKSLIQKGRKRNIENRLLIRHGSLMLAKNSPSSHQKTLLLLFLGWWREVGRGREDAWIKEKQRFVGAKKKTKKQKKKKTLNFIPTLYDAAVL